MYPERPFLGERQQILKGAMAQYNVQTGEREYGEYIWQTFQETDDIVEAFAKILVKRKLCPIIKSDTEGTPDLKFIGIFSENRKQWFMSELAACSDSIVVVPVAVETQFINEDRICKVLDKTQLQTLCLSASTIQIVLDLKSNNKLPFVKNIILYDQPEDIHIALATQVGLCIYSFNAMVSDGLKSIDVTKEEPKYDSILMLGVTSGTTGDPKFAMLTHMNFISG